MTTSEPSSWKNISVRKKIALLPTFFIVAILLTILFTVMTVSSQRRDSVVIEINGRQRMLNERHFKEVLLAAFTTDRSRAKLEETRTIVNDTQKALIGGGMVLERLGKDSLIELPGAPSAEIRTILENQQKLMREFEVEGRPLQIETAAESELYGIQGLR